MESMIANDCPGFFARLEIREADGAVLKCARFVLLYGLFGEELIEIVDIVVGKIPASPVPANPQEVYAVDDSAQEGERDGAEEDEDDDPQGPEVGDKNLFDLEFDGLRELQGFILGADCKLQYHLLHIAVGLETELHVGREELPALIPRQKLDTPDLVILSQGLLRSLIREQRQLVAILEFCVRCAEPKFIHKDKVRARRYDRIIRLGSRDFERSRCIGEHLRCHLAV